MEFHEYSPELTSRFCKEFTFFYHNTIYWLDRLDKKKELFNSDSQSSDLTFQRLLSYIQSLALEPKQYPIIYLLDMRVVLMLWYTELLP